jgi:hypothetical protein
MFLAVATTSEFLLSLESLPHILREIKVEIMVSFRHNIYFASGDREQQSSAAEWERDCE